MYFKVFSICAIVAYAQAGVFELHHDKHATSYASFNQHIAPVHAAHVPVATLHAASAVHHASSYSTVNKHIAPVTTYHAAPVAQVAHVAHVAPVAHISHASHVAPVAHVSHVSHVAPVAHVAHVAHAAPVAHYSHVAPVVKSVAHEVYADVHPHYSFEYGVKDTHTGDIKNQHEERDGDVVKGFYSLVQPDGITRNVHYTADHKNGFNAQVEYTGQAHKAVVPVKAVVAAPVYHPYHH